MKVIQFATAKGQYGDTIRVLTADGRMFEKTAGGGGKDWGWTETKLPMAKDFERNKLNLHLDENWKDIKVNIPDMRRALTWLHDSIEREDEIKLNRGSLLHDYVKGALGLKD